MTAPAKTVSYTLVTSSDRMRRIAKASLDSRSRSEKAHCTSGLAGGPLRRSWNHARAKGVVLPCWLAVKAVQSPCSCVRTIGLLMLLVALTCASGTLQACLRALQGVVAEAISVCYSPFTAHCGSEDLACLGVWVKLVKSARPHPAWSLSSHVFRLILSFFISTSAACIADWKPRYETLSSDIEYGFYENCLGGKQVLKYKISI